MNENYHVYFKVCDANGRVVTTGQFGNEYKTDRGAKKFVDKMTEMFPKMEIAVSKTNPFVK